MENPRIITGKFKGRKLKVPENARPVTDRVKTVIFDMLGDIQDRSVADIFAGSGNLGIEALSRGASHATFLDSDHDAIEAIKSNLNLVQAEDSTYAIRQGNGKSFPNNAGANFDLIFIDPPFSLINTFDYSKFAKILNPNGVIILKTQKDDRPKLGNLEIIEKREVGINTLYFLKSESI